MFKKISIIIICVVLLFGITFFPTPDSYSQKVVIHKFNCEEIGVNKLQRILMLKKTYWDKLGPIQIYFFDNYLKMNQLTTKVLGISYATYKDKINRMVSEGVAKEPVILLHSISVIQAVREKRNALGIIDDGIILSKGNLIKYVCIDLNDCSRGGYYYHDFKNN